MAGNPLEIVGPVFEVVQNLSTSSVIFGSRRKCLVIFSLRKQPSFFAPGPSGVSREGRLRFTAENSILMTKICPDLVMSADWFDR